MKFHTYIEALYQRVNDSWHVFVLELRRVFRDPGVVLIFFVAGLAYPILYNLIYVRNVVREVPVAVVDMSGTQASRDFIYRWDATPEVTVTHQCTSLAEAQQLLNEQKIHGILYIPADYNTILETGMETAHLSLYCDMSSFLYMKNVYQSANMVVIDLMNNIQIDRYEQMHIDHETAWTLVQSVPYTSVDLFNPTGGYGTFLVLPILVLIIHQTLFLGICMLCGTAREENQEVFILPGRKRRYSVLRLLLGRAAAYFLIYMVLASYAMLLIPVFFALPHTAVWGDMIRFMVPFLLSTIFFSIFFGTFQKERETGMVTMLSTSLIFFFLSGVSWPKENMSPFWQMIADCLPSTWAINGYVHMQSMGADLATVSHEYRMLWLLTAVYFAACMLLYAFRARQHDQHTRQQDALRRKKLQERLKQEISKHKKTTLHRP